MKGGPIPLIDLDPKWLGDDGARIGISFACPIDDGCMIGVYWVRPSWDRTEREELWTMTGTTFEDVTLAPSINGIPSGLCHFHGFLRVGQVTWV